MAHWVLALSETTVILSYKDAEIVFKVASTSEHAKNYSLIPVHFKGMELWVKFNPVQKTMLVGSHDGSYAEYATDLFLKPFKPKFQPFTKLIPAQEMPDGTVTLPRTVKLNA